MKNIELIFESVNEIPVNRKARRNKTIEILVSDKIFRSNTLAAIIGKLKYLLKYKEEDFHINIIFKNTLQFGDKITYILLDSILYYTLIKSSVTIQPSRKEYHKKECSFSEVLLVNVMKIESYFPLKWFQYFR